MKMILFFTLFITSIFATNISDYINKTNCNQIIDKQVYTICYDYKNKGAKFVAYELDGKLVNKTNIKKSQVFITNPQENSALYRRR